MNARVCSALNPEVFPKYRRSLATASIQTEISPASSGVLERVVIIVVVECSITFGLTFSSKALSHWELTCSHEKPVESETCCQTCDGPLLRLLYTLHLFPSATL